MNCKLKALMIGLALLGSVAAQAQERFVSDTFARNIRQQSLDVLRELRIFGAPRTRLNSVFLVVSTERGRGILDVVANGRLLFSRQVGTFFESFQIPINGELGRDLRDVQVYFRGDFNLAMLGASIDEGFGGGYPGGGGHGPGDGNGGYPGGGHGPGDGHGGYPGGGYPGGGGGYPHPRPR